MLLRCMQFSVSNNILLYIENDETIETLLEDKFEFSPSTENQL